MYTPRWHPMVCLTYIRLKNNISRYDVYIIVPNGLLCVTSEVIPRNGLHIGTLQTLFTHLT